MSELDNLVFKKPTKEYLKFRNQYDTVIQPMINKFHLLKNKTPKQVSDFLEKSKSMALDIKKRFPYSDK